MKNIGVFIDVPNLFYSVRLRYPNRKLSYTAYLRYIKEFGNIVCARAYGSQIAQEAAPFIKKLEGLGITCFYKTAKLYVDSRNISKYRANWNVGIALDIVKQLNDFDIVVLGSGNIDMLPVVEHCIAANKTVIILAANIMDEYKLTSKDGNNPLLVEIPKSILESSGE